MAIVLWTATSLVILTTVCAVPLRKANSTELAQVVSYFLKYGHTSPSKLAKQGKKGDAFTSLEKDLRKFQQFAGLKETGELDEATIKKLKEPRCGLKDNVGQMAIVKSKTGRKKRFALHGSRWKVRDLTYSVENAPTSVNDQGMIDDLVGDALDTWARVSDLNFKKVPAGQRAHIEVKFASSYHGDGDPFDGRGGTLAHAFFPLYGGDAHFDDDEPWSINSRRGANLYVAAAHEFGHSLGLAHSNVHSLMSPWYQRPRDPATRDMLFDDDVTAIQRLYGPRRGDPPKKRKRQKEMPPYGGRGGGRRRWRPGIGQVPFLGSAFPRYPPRRDSDTKSGNDEVLCQNAAIDAVLTVGKRTYVFQKERYWRLTSTGVAKGYPKKIVDMWDGIPGNLDAAFYSRDEKKIYIFKGSQVWRLTSNYEVERDFPKPVSDVFPGTVARDLSAAFVWGKDGYTYLIKGEQYWKVGVGAKKGSSPKPLSDWRGLPNNIDAATQYNNGKTYFFVGQKYYRFDDDSMRIDGDRKVPYPRETGEYWFACGR